MEAWLRDRFERRGMAFPSQPQAGMADPFGRSAAKSERHGTRPARGSAWGSSSRHAAGPAPRDAPHVARRGAARLIPGASAGRSWRAPGASMASASRTSPSCLGGAAPCARPAGSDLCAGRSRGRSASPRADQAPRSASHEPGRSLKHGSPGTSGPPAETTWAGAVAAALEQRGWTLAIVELGMGGALGAPRRDGRRAPDGSAIASATERWTWRAWRTTRARQPRPTSVLQCGRCRAARTPRCRSAFGRRTATGRSAVSPSSSGSIGRSRAALSAASGPAQCAAHAAGGRAGQAS